MRELTLRTSGRELLCCGRRPRREVNSRPPSPPLRRLVPPRRLTTQLMSIYIENRSDCFVEVRGNNLPPLLSSARRNASTCTSTRAHTRRRRDSAGTLLCSLPEHEHTQTCSGTLEACALRGLVFCSILCGVAREQPFRSHPVVARQTWSGCFLLL